MIQFNAAEALPVLAAIFLACSIGAFAMRGTKRRIETREDEYERDAFDNYTPRRMPDDPNYQRTPAQGKMR